MPVCGVCMVRGVPLCLRGSVREMQMSRLLLRALRTGESVQDGGPYSYLPKLGSSPISVLCDASSCDVCSSFALPFFVIWMSSVWFA